MVELDSSDWSVDMLVEAFSLLMIDVGGHSPLYTVLPLGRWS